jgi:hypothetical protein
MKSIRNALVVLCAAAVLTACSHADHHHAADDVILIQRGSRVTNAYALAYQTCATTPTKRIVADVMAPSFEPSTVASSLARASFAAPVRAAAARGCLDALQRRAPHPPN